MATCSIVFQASSSEDVILGCIRAYHKVFCHYLDSNDIQHLPDEQNHKGKNPFQIITIT